MSFDFQRIENNEDEKIVVRVSNLSKVYKIYEKPMDRIKEMIIPRIQELIGAPERKYYQEHTVLKNISFKIKRYESVGIIGSNGTGKSTLLQIICGILNKSKGKVEINGRISGIFELGSGFNIEFTGRENVYLNGTLIGLKKEQIRDTLNNIIEFSEIGEFIDRPVKFYSTGMLMRLAFSMHVYLTPDILIIDEALSVGDIYFQQKCFSYLKHHLKNCCKIFVTHDTNALSKLADRVIVIDKGELVFDGSINNGLFIYNQIIQSTPKKNRTSSNAKEKERKDKKESLVKINNSTSKEPKYETTPFNKITGTGEVLIEKYAITINDEKDLIVKKGSKVSIYMKIRSLTESPGQLALGFFTKNRLSQRVFGQNTLSHFPNKISHKKGTFFASFSFEWPRVESGEYTLTLGVGEINQLGTRHKVQCWINDFIVFSCQADEPEHAILMVDLFNLNISKIKDH